MTTQACVCLPLIFVKGVRNPATGLATVTKLVRFWMHCLVVVVCHGGVEARYLAMGFHPFSCVSCSAHGCIGAIMLTCVPVVLHCFEGKVALASCEALCLVLV